MESNETTLSSRNTDSETNVFNERRRSETDRKTGTSYLWRHRAAGKRITGDETKLRLKKTRCWRDMAAGNRQTIYKHPRSNCSDLINTNRPENSQRFVCQYSTIINIALVAFCRRHVSTTFITMPGIAANVCEGRFLTR